MPARRFFVEGHHDEGETLALSASDAHKAAHVLRLGENDRIEIVDSSGRVFDARLVDANRVLSVCLKAVVAEPKPDLAEIHVAQGVPKGAKMDFVVEKLTELGVAAIVPFTSERTVSATASGSKLERWRRLAATASAQSGRTKIPEIVPPMPFESLLARFDAYDTVLFPWEAADARAIRRLTDEVKGAQRILAVIGPEGGFSANEADRAIAGGATVLSLGDRILRTETAGLALVAVLQYELALLR